MKKILLVALVLSALILSAAAYVAIRVTNQVGPALAILTTEGATPTRAQIIDAKSRVRVALTILDGPVAGVLRSVPVARQNIDAIRAVLEKSVPVLDSTVALTLEAERIEDVNILQNGRFDLEALKAPQEALARSARVFSELDREIKSRLNGWLLPPLWDRLQSLEGRVEKVSSSLNQTSDLLMAAEALLGVDGERKYLVLLVNNSELRGAGGVLTGVGDLEVNQGRFELGPFRYYEDLQTGPPYVSVPAPPEYQRRFAAVEANTTLWINATYSPDFPDVAAVTAELYSLTAGIDVDGVILADPRGVASLVPGETRLTVPGTEIELGAADVAKFIYSDAYDVLGGESPRRRETIVDIGRTAVGAFLDAGSIDRSSLERISSATAGGHLRIVSFQEEEGRTLDRAGISGDIYHEPEDSLLVTVQNLGADKLDFWMQRSIEHACDIRTKPARCVTRVTLANRAPEGLTDYVAPRPGGLARQYLEVYVPEKAEIESFKVDGRPFDRSDAEMAGRVSLGLEIDIPSGTGTTVDVTYYLPMNEDGYKFVATPQPLARDAQIKISLIAPEEWIVEGLSNSDRDVAYSYSGTFDREIRVKATPNGKRGLSRAWSAFSDFLTEPIF